MSHRSIAQPILGTQLVNAISMKHPCVLKCNYTPDDVLFNGLNPVLEKDAAREPGRGRPDGVDAADLSSSVCFLLPASMLKGRNQPEGAGDGVALPDALPDAVPVAEPPRNGEAPANIAQAVNATQDTKDAECGPGTGRPDGVGAADLSSSVCFLLPASMLKGRNQTGDGVALPDALSVAEPPRNGEAPACNHHTSGP